MSNKAAFGALTPEQQTILRDKIVSDGRPVGEWLALLEPLADYDRNADARRKTLGGWLIGVPMIGIILAIIGFIVDPIAGIVVVGLTVGGFLALYPSYRFNKNLDLHNGPLEFIVPLLPILAQDVDPGYPIALRIDMRGPLMPEKRQGQSPQYSRGVYYKIVDTYYHDPWFGGSVHLVDGTDVTWTVTDLVISQKKTKRNPRGKIKTKVKNKRKSQLIVTAAFAAKNYLPAGGPPPPQPARKETIKKQDNRTTIKLTRVLKSSDIQLPVDPRHFVDLLARAYQRVTPARRKKL